MTQCRATIPAKTGGFNWRCQNDDPDAGAHRLPENAGGNADFEAGWTVPQ